ncbi:MAG: polysaccharide deacetylase family protein [Thermicanus sp.]|nr:polysaccharide deacetylase family protein [Thermicanus sp.]
MRYFVWGFLLFLLVSFLLPPALSHLFSLGVIRRFSSSKGIALTFDDGPHPYFTPKLLQLLDAYQVKATFFVVGDQARKYPELIRSIAEKGHEIGLHNPHHWPNCFFLPWRLRRELDRMADEIERITGKRSLYYRPPWGIITVYDYLFLRPYSIFLWSVIPKDWSKKTTVALLKERILSQVKHGDIILLHDNGDTFGADPTAPSRMLEALKEVLETTRDWGYEFLTLKQFMERKEKSVFLPWWKRVLIFLFLRYDQVFRKFARISFFVHSDDFLHGQIKRYDGPTLVLSDGTSVKQGDLVLDLHFNNELMAQLAKETGSTTQLAVHLLRMAARFMPVLARKLEQDPRYKEVKALYGLTLMYRGSRQFGFEVFDPPNSWRIKIAQLYMRLLMAIIHPEGRERVQKRSEVLVPKMVAISRDQFIQRYAHEEEIEHQSPRSPVFQ